MDVLAVDIGVVIDVRVRVTDELEGSWLLSLREILGWFMVLVMGIVALVEVNMSAVDDRVANETSVGTMT